jgi:uncharacterized Zn-finger protein
VIAIIEAESDCGEVMEEIDDETEIENVADEMNENDNESVNKTFLNPSQADMISNEKVFKCLQCDFETTTKGDIVEHKRESHNWCSFCFSTFSSQEILKDHVDANHTT